MGNTAYSAIKYDGLSGYSGYSGYSGVGIFPIIIGHTWNLAGEFGPELISGYSNFNYLNPIFILVPGNKTIALKFLTAYIKSGTSATVHLYVNDVYIDWGITATTAGVTYTPTSDYILTPVGGVDTYYRVRPKIVATSATPSSIWYGDYPPCDLSFTLFVQYNS